MSELAAKLARARLRSDVDSSASLETFSSQNSPVTARHKSLPHPSKSKAAPPAPSTTKSESKDPAPSATPADANPRMLFDMNMDDYMPDADSSLSLSDLLSPLAPAAPTTAVGGGGVGGSQSGDRTLQLLAQSQAENAKLVSLLATKDVEIKNLKQKLSTALSGHESRMKPRMTAPSLTLSNEESPQFTGTRGRQNTTDLINFRLKDKLNVYGLEGYSATDLIGGEGEQPIFGIGCAGSDAARSAASMGSHKKQGKGNSLFDDDDESSNDHVYDYAGTGAGKNETSAVGFMKRGQLTTASSSSLGELKESASESSEDKVDRKEEGTKRRNSLLANLTDISEAEDSNLFVTSKAGGAPKAQEADTGGDGELTYKDFLTRLMLPDSVDIVDFIRRFVGSILGPNGDGTPPLPAAASKLDYEFFGGRDIQSRCSGFGYHMECMFESHPAWKHVGEAGLISARNGLEKYVMTKIADEAFKAVIDDEEDKRIQRRCRLLEFITPKMLDIDESVCNETVFSIAQDELRKINGYRSPGDKINCVTRACSLIFSAFKFVEGNKDKAAGADDFLPVFICVVLGANVPRLISNCEYIESYCNRNTMMTKAGYCFCNLRSAIEFILTVEASSLSIDKDEFDKLLRESEAKLQAKEKK